MARLHDRVQCIRNSTHPDNQLMALIRDELDEKGVAFAQRFYGYLLHDADADFVVDLDDVYQCIGFRSKVGAKRAIVQHLRSEEQYRLSQDGRGPRNQDRILMTVQGFKHLCRVLDTRKSGLVYTYYMSMELAMMKYKYMQSVDWNAM